VGADRCVPGEGAGGGPYDVRIVRDRFGVPHVFGRRDADVAYGLAYAHAEDDFATLEEVVAMTRGRLGALTGTDGAATDYVAELIEVRATVERDYGKQPADVRALLDAYAAGLNRYAEKHPGEPRLPGLFPVDGKDVAAGFVLRSPFFFGLDTVLEALVGDKDLRPERGAPLPDAPNVTPAGPAEIEKGSNAFAIAPSRSADGATRLVSNAHQPWSGGVAWYEAVVHSEEGWDFAGRCFPARPSRCSATTARSAGPTPSTGPTDRRLQADARREREALPVRRQVAAAAEPPDLAEGRHGAGGAAGAADHPPFGARAGDREQARRVRDPLCRRRPAGDDRAILPAEQSAQLRRMAGGDGAAGRAGHQLHLCRRGRQHRLFLQRPVPGAATGLRYGKVLPGDRSAAVWRGSAPFSRCRGW
jgi:hypothetical protein